MHVFGIFYTAEVYGKLKCSTTFNATPSRQARSIARNQYCASLLPVVA